MFLVIGGALEDRMVILCMNFLCACVCVVLEIEFMLLYMLGRHYAAELHSVPRRLCFGPDGDGWLFSRSGGLMLLWDLCTHP